MKFIQIYFALIIILGISTVYANERPTIQFAGKTYYMQKSYNEIDSQHSPVNVVEIYLPVGQTADNYSSFIKRVTMLQVTDYKSAANSQLHELLEDNKNIPHELIEDAEKKRVILSVTFWWPFRPTVVEKEVYIFQMDRNLPRVMYYLVGENIFYNASSISNDELVKEGKTLLTDSKIVNEAKELSF